MRPFRWSAEKNDVLKEERGASFERMVVAIEDIPYQTLIASMLHRYVTGRLTERPF